VKKKLHPSSWYTFVYKENEVYPILTKEQGI